MTKKMNISATIRTELDYFKKLNAHFTLKAGKASVKVAEANDRLLFMAMSASFAMDLSEDGFFEAFNVTDKALTGSEEQQLDAFALVETDEQRERHLHLFQYKLYEKGSHALSPTELLNFATLMNNVFVHPEFRMEDDLKNPVLKSVHELTENFVNAKRGNRIRVHCHFINNAQGVTASNSAAIEGVMGRFKDDQQTLGFRLQVYGIREVEELALEGKIKVGRENLEFMVDGANAYRAEDNATRPGLGLPNKVFVGVCNVNEFIRLQNKYHHNQLYGENIRLYLGDRAAVNKDIIRTITSAESNWFPYMNNGISIICDKLIIGSTNATKKTIGLELENMQIINGCQTVNALYSARYNKDTADNFRSSNVMVKVFEVRPDQKEFKLAVIKASNNQNAVNTYSLLANEPIQIAIQDTLKKFGFLYDRKGEAKLEKTDKVVSMPNAALAYRAVFWFEAQKLRSRIGKSRVFHKSEYEKLYPSIASDSDDSDNLFRISVELLVASLILDSVRDLIPKRTEEFSQSLPIFNKAAYYLAGLMYAMNKDELDSYLDSLIELLKVDNPHQMKSTPIPAHIKQLVNDCFDEMVEVFSEFYVQVEYDLETFDIDNLLKSGDFGKRFEKLVSGYTSDSGSGSGE